MFRRTFASSISSNKHTSMMKVANRAGTSPSTTHSLSVLKSTTIQFGGGGVGSSSSSQRHGGLLGNAGSSSSMFVSQQARGQFDSFKRTSNLGGSLNQENENPYMNALNADKTGEEENADMASRGVIIKPDSTLVSLWEDCALSFANRKFLGNKMWARGQLAYFFAPYNGLHKEVMMMVHLLHNMGVEKGNRVCMISDNRYEWFIVFQATLALGAQFVGVPTNVTPGEAQQIVRATGAKVLFVETQASFAAVRSWAHSSTTLDHVICLDDPSGEASYAVVIALVEAVPEAERFVPRTKVSPDDTAAILFTAGTTGPPKGCMLSHKCLIANISSCHAQFGESLSPDDVFLSLCPWTVAGSLTIELYQCMLNGAAMAIPPEILEGLSDIEKVNPSIVCSPPLPFQRLYNNIYNDVMQMGTFKKDFTRTAIGALSQARQNMEKPSMQAQALAKAATYRYKKQFGTDLRLLVIIGQYLGRDMCEMFADLGLFICNTYGCLEAGGVIATDVEVMTRLKVLPGVEVRIVNDNNEVVVPGDIGEILVEAPHAMQGYFDCNLGVNEEDGALVVHGNRSFVRTGDFGSLSGPWLTVRGNKDALITLQNGKVVDPTETEREVQASPFIKQCFVFGDRRDYLIALIVPLRKSISNHLRKIERRDGVPIVSDREIADCIRADIRRMSDNLQPSQHIRRFCFVEDMNQSNGFLTCKMDYARQKIEAHYVHYINQLYDDNPKFFGYAVDDWDDLF